VLVRGACVRNSSHDLWVPNSGSNTVSIWSATCSCHTVLCRDWHFYHPIAVIAITVVLNSSRLGSFFPPKPPDPFHVQPRDRFHNNMRAEAIFSSWFFLFLVGSSSLLTNGCISIWGLQTAFRLRALQMRTFCHRRRIRICPDDGLLYSRQWEPAHKPRRRTTMRQTIVRE
jgi:hypothetical protein